MYGDKQEEEGADTVANIEGFRENRRRGRVTMKNSASREHGEIMTMHNATTIVVACFGCVYRVECKDARLHAGMIVHIFLRQCRRSHRVPARLILIWQ